MKTRCCGLFLLLLIVLSSNPFISAYAAFPDLGVGVRPMGMGGAYIGIANDANAPLWNVAGLTQITQRELIATYSTLYAGLNAQLFTGETDSLGYHFVSYVQPVRVHSDSVGISWLAFDSMFYDEQTYVLSYAKRITPQISAGIGTRILRVNIATNEYTRADADLAGVDLTRMSTTLDLSFLYAISDRLQIGVVGENLLPADIGILQTQEVPTRWGIGIVRRSTHRLEVIDFVLRNRRLSNHRDFNVRVGLEQWLFQGQVGVRAGYNVQSVTLGGSYRYGREEPIQLDYAFIYPINTIVGTLGSHRVGLTVRF